MPFRSSTKGGSDGSQQTGQEQGPQHSQPSQVLGNVPPPFAKTVDENDTCPPCNKTVTNEGILCEGCYTWFHQSCSKLSNITFQQLALSREAWYCSVCKQSNNCYPSSDNSPQDCEYGPDDFCGKCKKNFHKCRSNSKCIYCEQCGIWYHISCAGVSKQIYEYYSELNNTDVWTCKSCKQKSSNHPRKVYWGNSFNTEQEIKVAIDNAYNEIVGWTKNVFLLPRGNSGKDFIKELTRLINTFVNKTPHECFSLSLVHIFMPLMLQKPSERSKARDHSKYLAQRLQKWKNGEIVSLMAEAREIQKRHQKIVEQRTVNKTKLFCQLMLLGKISQATKLISEEDSVVGVHPINEEIIDILCAKHPKAAEPINFVDQCPVGEFVQPVIFESIDESTIYDAAKNTFGSGGPTQIDADGWKHILCSKSYGKLSEELCQVIADMAKRLCTEKVEPDMLNELLSCRLIPLNKNPGVRPIGVGEVLRRIIGKAVMQVLKEDIVLAGGTLQTCAGIDSGIEAAVHSMAKSFNQDGTEAILLVDASNAFNSMNRSKALLTVKDICPAFYQYLSNTYQSPTHQYISGSKEGHFVWSEEGATQGDNCAMAFYALGTSPVIKKLNTLCDATQVFYADDDSACGTLDELLRYWNELGIIGPEYGYFPNAKKTILIVKHQKDLQRAKEMFDPLNVVVTCEGERHLGAVVGSKEFKEEYVNNKVRCWVKDIEDLANIAKDEPQLAYACYTKGLSHRWTYVLQTIPDIQHLVVPLEEAIRNIFIPAMLGRVIFDTEREILELPDMVEWGCQVL